MTQTGGARTRRIGAPVIVMLVAALAVVGCSKGGEVEGATVSDGSSSGSSTPGTTGSGEIELRGGTTPGTTVGTSPKTPDKPKGSPGTTGQVPGTTGTPSPTGPDGNGKASLTLARDGFDAVRFGAPAAEAVAKVTSRLGPPDDDGSGDGPPAECGSVDRSVRWKDLSVTFAEGVMVGYAHLKAPNGPVVLKLRTAESIAVGSTIAQVKKVYPTVQIREDSLGPEWIVEAGTDFIGGFATGIDDAAAVTGIYAGRTCFIR